MKNYYEILNISVDASQEELVKAYNKIKFMYSEKLVSSDLLYEGSEESILKEIEEAYLTLSNTEKRVEYNKKHKIKSKRDIVRYNFDVPLDIEKSVVELPRFAKVTTTNYTEKLNKINKKRLAPKGLETPDYKIDLEKENLIQNEKEYRGSFFKFVREYKNMSYEFVSSKTKIPISYIKDIENENFEELPAKVYVKGFIKTYAKLLQLPANIILERYMSYYDRTYCV